MGIVRFGLAMLVVYFHTKAAQIFGITLPNGRIAVQLFYVISGFYMALILNEKYDSTSTNMLFYSNRFFRLWPPMMVVIALVALQFTLTGKVLLLDLETSLSNFLSTLAGFDPLTLVYVAFTNLFVFGQDWIWFIRVDATTGVTWCPAFACNAHNGSSFLLDHPTFTVAIEASYYLIAPFVLRRSLALAFTLFALGAAWHVYVAAAGLNELVWGYHFVASAGFFFFAGACAYHVYARYAALPDGSALRKLLRRVEFPAYVVAVLLAGLIYATLDGIRNFVIALMLAAVIPLLFDRTRQIGLDRSAGELSYGIYLVHFPIWLLTRDVLGPQMGALATLGLVVPAALVLYLAVERPVDRWRQKRARAATGRQRQQAPSLDPAYPQRHP